MTPIADIEGMERVSLFGVLWGVRIRTFAGYELTCLVSSRGERKAAEEEDLERTLFAVMEGAHAYWTTKIASELASSKTFEHRGVRISAEGEVSGHGVTGTLFRGRLGHEIEGEVLRVKFVSAAAVNTVEWRPGLARDAIIAVLYEMKEKIDRMGKAKPDPGTERLRRKAKLRMDDTVARLAAVLARTDLIEGRVRLADFCTRRGLTVPSETFIAVAPGLLIQKFFIQKSFEEIQRFNERTMQHRKSADLFVDLIDLAVHDGRLTARQLFALYEIGLHLDFTLPRITAMVSAVQTGDAPNLAAEESDRREAEAAARRETREDPPQEGEDAEETTEENGGDADQGQDAFEDFGPTPDIIPFALIPFMEILGLEELADEKALRMAWTTKVRACHPDTLPPDAGVDAVEAATRAAADCNMAYSVLLRHLRGGRQ
jgi:hypothetical protein